MQDDHKNEIVTDDPTRERFLRIVRRKLGERGYSGEQLEAKFNEITSKQDIGFDIDWDKVINR